MQVCIERMLNLTDHLRRLKVDKYEYVAMKVIVLLSSGMEFYGIRCLYQMTLIELYYRYC